MRYVRVGVLKVKLEVAERARHGSLQKSRTLLLVTVFHELREHATNRVQFRLKLL
jgi:hypothetical protein